MVSVVSPDRWLITVSRPWVWADSIASQVSVRAPIWFGLISTQLRADLDTAHDPFGVRDEEIVAADKAAVGDLLGEVREALEVLLVKGVLDVDQVVAVDELGDVRNLLIRGPCRVLVPVRAVLPELARSNIDAHVDHEADLVRDGGDSLMYVLEGGQVVDRKGPRSLVALARALAHGDQTTPDLPMDGGVREDPVLGGRRAGGHDRNSWISVAFSACAPPPITFPSGNGVSPAKQPPR